MSRFGQYVLNQKHRLTPAKQNCLPYMLSLKDVMSDVNSCVLLAPTITSLLHFALVLADQQRFEFSPILAPLSNCVEKTKDKTIYTACILEKRVLAQYREIQVSSLKRA